MKSVAETSSISNWKPARSWILFGLLFLFILWLAHAMAFFPHEYAHSFTAWILGWKANPLALNYGGMDASNLLLQGDIDENVDYSPIFSSGHDFQAGIIAAAGMVIGNGFITYPISLWGFRKAQRHGNRGWGLFFYWLCLDSVGNFIDYVPERTFAASGDMHTLATGFHCSPWWIIIVPGIPFGIALFHFLFRFVPQGVRWLFPDSPGRRVLIIVFSSLMLWGFYGMAGLPKGPVSHSISLACITIGIPLMLAGELWAQRSRGSLSRI